MQLRDHPGVMSKRDYFLADPRKIEIEEGYNVRDLTTPDAKAALAELKASIIENGVREPIKVRLVEDRMVLVAGHRRLTAVMDAIETDFIDIKSVPVIAEAKTVNEVERVLDLALSNSGMPLTQMELAEVVRRLMAHGWDRSMIAKRMGKTSQAISNYEALLGASPEVQAMVKAGEVAPSVAAAVVKKEGAKAGETLRKAKASAKTKGKKKGKVTASAVKKSKGKGVLKPAQVEVLLTGLRKLATRGSCEADREKAAKLLHSVGLSVEE